MNWPHGQDPSPEDLASQGFYYDPTIQHQDAVSCFFCQNKEFSWENPTPQIEMKDGLQIRPPIIRHLQNFPDCFNAEILSARFECEHDPDFKWQNDTNFSDPVASTAIRLKTFTKWPYDDKRKNQRTKAKKYPTSEELAANGFYMLGYEQKDDAVTCLYCGVSLEGWEPGDNAIEEHRKRNKDCYIFHYKELARNSTAKNSSIVRLSEQKQLIEPEENYDEVDTGVDSPIDDGLDNEIDDEPSLESEGSIQENTNSKQPISSSFKVDQHGLTYEEIPDQGYLDDMETRKLKTQSTPVHIPSSSLNELSDFFIEPSASGPSTFLKRSSPKKQKPIEKKSGKNHTGEKNYRQSTPESNHTPDHTSKEEHAQNEGFEPPDFDDFPNTPPALDEPIPQNDSLDQEPSPRHAIEKQADNPGTELVLRRDTEMSTLLPDDIKKTLVETIKNEIREELMKELASIRQTTGEAVNEIKHAVEEKSQARTEKTITVKKEVDDGSNGSKRPAEDEEGSIRKRLREQEEDAEKGIEKDTEKDTEQSQEEISSRANELSHILEEKMEEQRQKIKEAEERERLEKEEEERLERKRELEKQELINEKIRQEKEKQEREREDRERREEERKDRERKEKERSEKEKKEKELMEKKRKEQEREAWEREARANREALETERKKLAEAEKQRRNKLEELEKEKLAIKQERNRIKEERDRILQLAKEQEEHEGDKENNSGQDEDEEDDEDIILEDAGMESTPLTKVTDGSEGTEFDKAAQCMEELLKNGCEILSEDMDGELTNFIAEMPDGERAMTIREWLEYRATQAAAVVRRKGELLKRALRENAGEALEVLERLPCDD